MKIEFENPPIHEVAISAGFNPQTVPLRSEHIGLFWAEIRDRFPVGGQRPPVGRSESISGDADFFPMPRYWFRSGDKTALIQVQWNTFVFNWRRGGGGYAGFDASLMRPFDRYFGVFEDFCRDHLDLDAPTLSIDHCRLHYFNLVRHCEYWHGPQDTGRILPHVSLPDLSTNHSGASALDCHYTLATEDDLIIRLRIRTGKSRDEQKASVLVFEIKANGRLGGVPKSVADGWYRRAHAAIRDCFLRVTDEDIRNRYWKPVEAAS